MGILLVLVTDGITGGDIHLRPRKEHSRQREHPALTSPRGQTMRR